MLQTAAPDETVPQPTRKRSTTNKPLRRRPGPLGPRKPRLTVSEPKPKPAPPKLVPAKLASVPLAEVIVGERHRKFVGNVAALARSIAETGVIEPLLVDAQMRLVDGYRRLLAAKELGVRHVPVRIMDLEDPLLAYIALNGQRKNLTASEKYAIAEELLGRAKDPAWRERALGGRLDGAARKGRLDEFVSAHVGLSRESLRKIRLIHNSAREDEERFGDLARALDVDGKVDRHFRELQRRLARGDQKAALAIVVEPTWLALVEDGDSLTKLKAANLSALGDAGCLLLFPAPLAHVASAARMISAAGFRWTTTYAGTGGEAWAVGVLGRGAKISSDVAGLLVEGCAQGAVGVSEALEAALGAPPLRISLATT